MNEKLYLAAANYSHKMYGSHNDGVLRPLTRSEFKGEIEEAFRAGAEWTAKYWNTAAQLEAKPGPDRADMSFNSLDI
jgi:hypothetical protein